MADELDEDSRRAEEWVGRLIEVPLESRPYWEFCQRVSGIDCGSPDGRICFDVRFELSDVARHTGVEAESISFLGFFARKLAKINRERERMAPFLGDYQ